MKIIKENGKVTYYYYKKKRGKKKKRGPKVIIENNKIIVKKSWDFKIVKCLSKRQSKYIGRYRNLQDVEVARKILLDKNKSVLFAKQNHNKNSKIWFYEGEYLILKANNSNDTNSISLIRNNYGKLVEHKTNNEKWVIYDKFPCVEEETFWVYGYDNINDRKTFKWIYDNLIDIEEIVRMLVYNNKLIIQYDDDFNFVICKNTSDAIKFYNIAEEMSKKKNNIIFTGEMIKRKGERMRYIFNLIKNKTGWDDKKIYRTKTT